MLRRQVGKLGRTECSLCFEIVNVFDLSSGCTLMVVFVICLVVLLDHLHNLKQVMVYSQTWVNPSNYYFLVLAFLL